MRIAILTNEYPPFSVGGAGRIAYIYNQLLEKHGHEVKVWNCGLKFGRWRSKKPIWRVLNHLLDLFPSHKIANEIIEWKPEILLTHNLTGCGFGTPRLVQFEKIRWIHFLHDVQLFEPSGKILFGEPHKFFCSLWRAAWSLARRLAMGKPDAAVSPTRWLFEEHLKYGFFRDVKCEVIPNPMSIDSFEWIPASSGMTERDPKQVLFVGRLDPDKGLGLLLDAWQKIRDLAGSLVIVGDGSMLEDVKRLNDTKVEVRGALSNQEVFKTMLQSGVVVVPSLVMENQPTVILEALAFSCRVVATDVGGIRETLDAAGWLVEPGAVDSLTLGIKAALSDPDDKERARNRDDVLNRHNPEESVERLMDLFRSNL